MKMNKLLLVPALGIFLTGCGIIGEGNSSIVASEYAPGKFYKSSNTGVYENIHRNGMEQCSSDQANDKYFESENAIVFASKSLPDSDFKHAATLIETQMPIALSKMNVSNEEYRSYKSRIGIEAQESLISFIVGVDKYTRVFTSSEFGKFLIDKDIDIDTNLGVFIDETNAALNSLSDSEFDALYNSMRSTFIEFNRHNHEVNNIDYVEDKLSEKFDEMTKDKIKYSSDKVVVCLHSGTSMEKWGQGSAQGVSLAPNSVMPRSDDGDIVLQELIHHIQGATTGKLHGLRTVQD